MCFLLLRLFYSHIRKYAHAPPTKLSDCSSQEKREWEGLDMLWSLSQGEILVGGKSVHGGSEGTRVVPAQVHHLTPLLNLLNLLALVFLLTPLSMLS